MKKLWSCLAASLLLAVSMSACAADFSLTDIAGKTHRLADYRGKWVLVNFWATWCPPCLNEVPELIALHGAHKDRDLVVIGVALDSTRSSVIEFSSREKINYPMIIGNHRMAEQIGEVGVLPTSYLYSPDGKRVASQAGEVNRADIESYIGSKSSGR